MAGSWEADLARRYLGAQRRSRFSSLIGIFSLLGVFIGTTSLVVATSLMNGFEEQVRDRLIGRDSHLDFLGWGPSGLPDGDSLPNLIEAADSRIVAASPFIAGKAGISNGNQADGIVVMGIDPVRAVKVIDIGNFMISGSLNLGSFPLDSGRVENGIVLGSTLASRLGVDTGDRVTLISLSTAEFSGSSAPRFDRARVTGVFHSGMYEFDANLAYVSVSMAQKIYRSRGRVSGIQVRVKDLWQASDVGRNVAGKLNGSLTPRDWFQKNETLMKWMRLEKVVVFLVLCLIVVVAAFNIASSLIMGVLERTREIGILRAMGASSGAVRKVFLVQGLMAGLGGAMGGMAFGLFLCWIQDHYHVITLPGSVYFIEYLPVSIHATDMALIFTTAIAICAFAAWFPAWKAARLDPVEAVRHE
ncbi:MAG TPA: ABC transporter permease [Fibrobacteria bacterium]|nr:ABC transporter permease [Fibrobacteria bacterium]